MASGNWVFSGTGKMPHSFKKNDIGNIVIETFPLIITNFVFRNL